MHSTIQVTILACVQQTYYAHMQPTHTHTYGHILLRCSLAVGVCGRTDFQVFQMSLPIHTDALKFSSKTCFKYNAVLDAQNNCEREIFVK